MSAPTPINLNDDTPTPPGGGVNVRWQADSNDPRNVSAYYSVPIVIGFVVNSGATGTNVGPMLAAVRQGSFTKCVVVTKTSDASTDLTFRIKQNGTDVFSSDPTVSQGTSSGTVSTFTSLTSVPLSVAEGDVFELDITSGAADWQFTVQLQ